MHRDVSKNIDNSRTERRFLTTAGAADRHLARQYAKF